MIRIAFMNDDGISGFSVRQDGSHVTGKRVCVKLKSLPQNDGLFDRTFAIPCQILSSLVD